MASIGIKRGTSGKAPSDRPKKQPLIDDFNDFVLALLALVPGNVSWPVSARHKYNDLVRRIEAEQK